MTKTRRFDVAELLETDEAIREFLSEVAQSGDAASFIRALGTVARAKGMTEIAKQAGVTRASLYKSLAQTGNPEFSTVMNVCNALGLRLMPQPIHGRASA